MKKAQLVVASLMAIAPSQAALAHHSFAEWTKAFETVSGTVIDYQWENPHLWIIVAVPGPNGGMVKWSFESGSPLDLKHRGWRAKSIKSGDKITITAHTNRDPTSKSGNIVKVVLPDQSVLTAEDIISNLPDQPASTPSPR